MTTDTTGSEPCSLHSCDCLVLGRVKIEVNKRSSSVDDDNIMMDGENNNNRVIKKIK